jgi:hypothetical protein
MDEVVLHDCEFTIEGAGQRWHARVLGRRLPEGNVWEGWIKFTSDAGREVFTASETTQPDRGAAEYWAQGLEPVYLEGALARALDVAVPP